MHAEARRGLARRRHHRALRREDKPVFYSPGWIPIGCSPRGRDFLCLDFDPAKGGKAGQVILFVTDFNERFQVAPSFAELLTVFLKEAKAGEIEF
ncbi:SMI1/KNR4 family protein [Nannocystis sp. SCPEA4]|uniref:SMI1/KNR4 family protein n=1 Tax=Nannocystis sp. SCPEA4 TaxID=2996787 RepID=UPI00226ECEB8|nr:SMI1/KNR4 family protein [Nannocystis sp. SCPEA4]